MAPPPQIKNIDIETNKNKKHPKKLHIHLLVFLEQIIMVQIPSIYGYANDNS